MDQHKGRPQKANDDLLVKQTSGPGGNAVSLPNHTRLYQKVQLAGVVETPKGYIAE